MSLAMVTLLKVVLMILEIPIPNMLMAHYQWSLVHDHSNEYLPNVNPCQSTGYAPDASEPRSHNVPHNVPIPNPYHPRSTHGTHEVSSIHLQPPHKLVPISYLDLYW